MAISPNRYWLFAPRPALRAPASEHATIARPAVAAIFSSLYIAQDAGIYTDVGLDVKEQVIQSIGSANAMIAGSIDFSSSSGAGAQAPQAETSRAQ